MYSHTEYFKVTNIVITLLLLVDTCSLVFATDFAEKDNSDLETVSEKSKVRDHWLFLQKTKCQHYDLKSCKELDWSRFLCRCQPSSTDNQTKFLCCEKWYGKEIRIFDKKKYDEKSDCSCEESEDTSKKSTTTTTSASPTMTNTSSVLRNAPTASTLHTNIQGIEERAVVAPPEQSMGRQRRIGSNRENLQSRLSRRREKNKPCRKYQEYRRERPNKIKYREMYTKAYHERVDERVHSAVSSGTAVGRFASARFQTFLDKFRFKRSEAHFSNQMLKSTPGIFYYTLSNLPNNFLDEDGVIAGTLSDWSAKAPICFRERVSTFDPPPNFSITFLPGQLVGAESMISRTVSANGGRQIQLNSDFVYRLGNSRVSVETENSLPAVVLHEVGHLLGIPHSHDSSRSSAMYDDFDSNNANNYLDTYESSQVQRMYGRCHGSTDAMTNILYDVGRNTYSTTFISRNTAVWEYSYELNRALEDYPIRNSQLFPGIHGTVDAMVQIYTDTPGTNPLFYVFKGTTAYKYTYSYSRHPRIRQAGSTSIKTLTRGKVRSADAALWSEVTMILYLFTGGKVCCFDAKWNFLRCSSINFMFQGLGNHKVDEAYQYIHNGEMEYAFFRGLKVYEGTYNGRFWSISRRGVVPNQRGYRWNDLCENLC